MTSNHFRSRHNVLMVFSCEMNNTYFLFLYRPSHIYYQWRDECPPHWVQRWDDRPIWCWWRKWETKCVGDNFGMLLTDLRYWCIKNILIIFVIYNTWLGSTMFHSLGLIPFSKIVCTGVFFEFLIVKCWTWLKKPFKRVDLGGDRWCSLKSWYSTENGGPRCSRTDLEQNILLEKTT